MPLISCLMPTANRPQMAQKAIMDFLVQSERDAELLILDDGDDPVQTHLASTRRVSLIRETQRASLYVKRERMIRMASGKILVFWDDDDIHGPDRLKAQLAELRKPKIEATYFCRVLARVEGILYESPPGRILPGTVAFWRAFHDRGGIVDTGVGSEIRFIQAKPRKVISPIDGREHYVVVRHGEHRTTLNVNGWKRVSGSPSARR